MSADHEGHDVTDRQQPPTPGAVLRAPVPQPSAAAPTAARGAGAAEPQRDQPREAAHRDATPAGAPLLQGRRGRGSAAAAGASAAADRAAAASPIARRRAAALRAAQESSREETVAAAPGAPTTASVQQRRIVEPPVEIRQRRWGGVHPGQLVAAEVAVVAAAAVSRDALSVLLPVAVVSAAILAASFVRIQGRWLYEWLGTALRYLFRARRAALDEQRPGDGVLAATTHGGALRRLEIDGAGVAVLTDSTGFTAVLEIVPDGADRPGRQRALPPLSELLPHNEPGDIPISVQVVSHTVPAPSVAAADDAAAHSYRELAGGQIPARRRTWVCVQAMHSADVPTSRAVEQALVNAVRRIDRRMRKAGFRARLRNVRETAADLLALIHVDPGQPAALREAWGQWTAGRSTHVTYRVSSWPALAHRAAPGPLIEGIDSVPAAARTSALAGRRVGEHVDVEAVLRFTTPGPAGRGAIDRALRELLRDSGADLQRLDGDHRFGVGATLPTGGFAV